MVKYYFDTYALFEIIKGNPNYAKYTQEEMSTGILNLYELYCNLIKEIPKEKAKDYFNHFKEYVMPFTSEIIFKASEFKIENKKENISYVDALGYAMALEKGMKFLTGDKAFKNKANVEFIK